MKTEGRTTEVGSIVETLLGGEKLMYGGTRKGVKLSRPVEAGVLFDREKTKCPFHREDEKSLTEYYKGEIRVLGNAFTPHRNHRLVIPRDCSDEMFVRTLGGREFLRKTFLVISAVADHTKEEKVFAAHVLRGQNVPHLHWHVYSHHPEEMPDLAREAAWTVPEEDRDLIVLETSHFQVVARGTRTGQLMFIPKSEPPLFRKYHIELADALSDIVALGNKVLVSTQGELPRYSVSGRISADQTFRYMVYTPDLAVMGCADDLADFNGTARARTWSSFETAEFLKSKL